MIFSLVCGVTMRYAPVWSLRACAAGGLFLVGLWSWYRWTDPQYLQLFGEAGMVIVVLGGSALTAAVGHLWPPYR